MSSPPSNSSQTPTSTPTADHPKTPEPKSPNQQSKDKDPSPTNEETKNHEEQEEDEGECGFCLFMKGGACKEAFINWENCIEEGEKNNENIVDKCFEATSALKKCMEANSDYYGPILVAEKAAEQEAVNQLNKEKEAAAAAATTAATETATEFDSMEEKQRSVSS